MLKLLKLLFWVVVVGAVLVGGDQVLVRVPLEAPGVSQVQGFYVDFRGRLLRLIGIEVAKPGSIEQMIGATAAAPGKKAQTPSRYLYVDDAGSLQFADSLEQVPARFRKDAQPLAD